MTLHEILNSIIIIPLQTTGQAFVSTYQTTFYKQNGYANEAFTYPIINSCLGFIAVLPAMCLVDSLG